MKQVNRIIEHPAYKEALAEIAIREEKIFISVDFLKNCVIMKKRTEKISGSRTVY